MWYAFWMTDAIFVCDRGILEGYTFGGHLGFVQRRPALSSDTDKADVSEGKAEDGTAEMSIFSAMR